MALAQVAAALRRQADPLEAAVDLLGRSGACRGISAVALVRFDPVNQRMVLAAGRDLPPEDAARIRAALEEGIIDWVIEEGQARLVPCLTEANGTLHLLCLPLVTGGEAVGAIVAPTSARPDDIAPAALEEVSRLCDVVAPAIALSAAEDFSSTLHARLQAVSEAARALGSVPDVADNLRRIARLAYHAAPCQGSIIYLPAGDETWLECRAFEGAVDPPARCPLRSGIAGWVAERRVPLAIADYHTDPRIAAREVDPAGVRTAIATPVNFGTQVPGVLMLVNAVGEADFSNRDLAILMALADQAGVAIERARLYEDLHQSYLATIYALANAIEARDPYTRGHSDRVTQMAIMTARHLGWPEGPCAEIEMGGILHDVGKIGIPDAVLHKPGPLTYDEYAIIKTHPVVGARMLKGIAYLEPAMPYILYHQERYDGKGYPEGLAGEAIPVQGRLLAVSDAVDAITSNRPYRSAATLTEAIDILKAKSGSQFDPDIAAAFVTVYESGQLADYLASAPARRI